MSVGHNRTPLLVGKRQACRQPDDCAPEVKPHYASSLFGESLYLFLSKPAAFTRRTPSYQAVDDLSDSFCCMAVQCEQVIRQ